jgi:hypothetical protein
MGVSDDDSPALDGVNSKPALKASTYNELIELTRVLSEKVYLLEKASRPVSPSMELSPKEPSLRTQVEYRVLPDVDRSIPMFKGREFNNVADDWINSVTGVAKLNSWDLR